MNICPNLRLSAGRARKSRNYSGSATAAAPLRKYAANKGTCQPNFPGAKRRQSGKICGKNFFGGTARLTNCLNLTKKSALKAPYLSRNGG